MSAPAVMGLLACALVVVAVAAALARHWIIEPRRRRAAALLYAEVRLQLLTQAAMAALLDEARRNLTVMGQHPS